MVHAVMSKCEKHMPPGFMCFDCQMVPNSTPDPSLTPTHANFCLIPNPLPSNPQSQTSSTGWGAVMCKALV